MFADTNWEGLTVDRGLCPARSVQPSPGQSENVHSQGRGFSLPTLAWVSHVPALCVPVELCGPGSLSCPPQVLSLCADQTCALPGKVSMRSFSLWERTPGDP